MLIVVGILGALLLAASFKRVAPGSCRVCQYECGTGAACPECGASLRRQMMRPDLACRWGRCAAGIVLLATPFLWLAAAPFAMRAAGKYLPSSALIGSASHQTQTGDIAWAHLMQRDMPDATRNTLALALLNQTPISARAEQWRWIEGNVQSGVLAPETADKYFLSLASISCQQVGGDESKGVFRVGLDDGVYIANSKLVIIGVDSPVAGTVVISMTPTVMIVEADLATVRTHGGLMIAIGAVHFAKQDAWVPEDLVWTGAITAPLPGES